MPYLRSFIFRESKGGTGEKRGPLVLSFPPSRSTVLYGLIQPYAMHAYAVPVHVPYLIIFIPSFISIYLFIFIPIIATWCILITGRKKSTV